MRLGRGTFLAVTNIFMKILSVSSFQLRKLDLLSTAVVKLCGLKDIVELCDLNDDSDVIFRTGPDLKWCSKMVQNQQTQLNKRLH